MAMKLTRPRQVWGLMPRVVAKFEVQSEGQTRTVRAVLQEQQCRHYGKRAGRITLEITAGTDALGRQQWAEFSGEPKFMATLMADLYLAGAEAEADVEGDEA